MVIRLWMIKEGPMMFLSHLELMRTFERCFKSARLPISYSQGFNPRPIMNFALPLAVGVEAEKLLLEIELKEGSDASLLEGVDLPKGLHLKDYKLVEKGPSLMSLVVSARYHISGDKEKIQKIKTKEALPFLKRNKRGRYNKKEARELIISYEEKGDGYDFLLKAGSRANLKPTDLLMSLLEKKEEVHSYNLRLLDVYDEKGKSLW